MNIKEFINKNFKILILIMTVSLACGLLLMNKIGIKDSAMFSLAMGFLLFEIYYSFIDMKISLLVFVVSFPILVTARKVLYVEEAFIRLTFEAVYIIIIALFKGREIFQFLKSYLKKKNNIQFNFMMLTGIFIILAFNSSVFSSNIMRSTNSAFLSVLVPVLFMLEILTFFNKEDINHIVDAFILSINLSSIYGFVQVLMNRIPFSMIRSKRGFITFGYHNINIYAGILVVILPFLLERILYRKNTKREKIFLYSSLVINLGALFITYSRGAWICFLIAVFLIMISKKYEKIVYALGIIGLLSARWIVPFILHRGKVNVMFFRNESMVARLQSIFTSLAIMIKYPFGAGGDNFAQMYKEFSIKGYLMMPKDFRVSTAIANYSLEMAHNLWLQIGVDFGILSAIVFLLIMINRMRAVKFNYACNRGAFIGIIMYLIFSVTTGLQFNHKGVITETLIIWAIFALIEINNRVEKGGKEYEKCN